MRLYLVVAVALVFAGSASGQWGPEMGMEMGMMGMGMASGLVDAGPTWTPDGSAVIFSRVTATLQANEWVAAPVTGGMMGMGGEMGMMGPEMGMMGPEMGGMPGMGMRGANLEAEGLFRVPATGGEPTSLVSGRALIQDVGGNVVAYMYQGTGAREYQRWGIYGTNRSGSGQTRWYPTVQLPWVSVSPRGDRFVIPYEQGKSVVFFPVRENVQENVGYCAAFDLKRRVEWTNDGDGVWVIQHEAPPAPTMPAGGMMGPEMMGGMMGPEGMGMMGRAPAQAKYHIAIGRPDQSVTPVIEEVGQDSFAVSIPNSTDIAACLTPAPGARARQVKAWPGDREGIYVFAADGTEKRKLTHQRARIMRASPDGSYIALLWGDRAPFTISVAPVDGRPVRRVAFNAAGSVSGSRAFDWSPDGSKIAYAGVDDEGNGVFVVDMNTGEVTRLSQAPKTERPAMPMGPGA